MINIKLTQNNTLKHEKHTIKYFFPQQKKPHMKLIATAIDIYTHMLEQGKVYRILMVSKCLNRNNNRMKFVYKRDVSL